MEKYSFETYIKNVGIENIVASFGVVIESNIKPVCNAVEEWLIKNGIEKEKDKSLLCNYLEVEDCFFAVTALDKHKKYLCDEIAKQPVKKITEGLSVKELQEIINNLEGEKSNVNYVRESHIQSSSIWRVLLKFLNEKKIKFIKDEELFRNGSDSTFCKQLLSLSYRERLHKILKRVEKISFDELESYNEKFLLRKEKYFHFFQSLCRYVCTPLEDDFEVDPAMCEERFTEDMQKFFFRYCNKKISVPDVMCFAYNNILLNLLGKKDYYHGIFEPYDGLTRKFDEIRQEMVPKKWNERCNKKSLKLFTYSNDKSERDEKIIKSISESNVENKLKDVVDYLKWCEWEGDADVFFAKLHVLYKRHLEKDIIGRIENEVKKVAVRRVISTLYCELIEDLNKYNCNTVGKLNKYNCEISYGYINSPELFFDKKIEAKLQEIYGNYERAFSYMEKNIQGKENHLNAIICEVVKNNYQIDSYSNVWTNVYLHMCKISSKKLGEIKELNKKTCTEYKNYMKVVAKNKIKSEIKPAMDNEHGDKLYLYSIEEIKKKIVRLSESKQQEIVSEYYEIRDAYIQDPRACREWKDRILWDNKYKGPYGFFYSECKVIPENELLDGSGGSDGANTFDIENFSIEEEEPFANTIDQSDACNKIDARTIVGKIIKNMRDEDEIVRLIKDFLEDPDNKDKKKNLKSRNKIIKDRNPGPYEEFLDNQLGSRRTIVEDKAFKKGLSAAAIDVCHDFIDNKLSITKFKKEALKKSINKSESVEAICAWYKEEAKESLSRNKLKDLKDIFAKELGCDTKAYLSFKDNL